MDRINGLILVFLLAFAVSTFVFIAGTFRENSEKEVPQYKVKVTEIQLPKEMI